MGPWVIILASNCVSLNRVGGGLGRKERGRGNAEVEMLEDGGVAGWPLGDVFFVRGDPLTRALIDLLTDFFFLFSASG